MLHFPCKLFSRFSNKKFIFGIKFLRVLNQMGSVLIPINSDYKIFNIFRIHIDQYVSHKNKPTKLRIKIL